MKFIIIYIAALFVSLCFCSCSNSNNQGDDTTQGIEIPRKIGGVELLAPISQYPQFEEQEEGYSVYRLLDGVKEYCNPKADEFEPKYVGVKDGKIVYIAVCVYGVPHIEAAEREIKKYGIGSDGKTSVEACPLRINPYNGATIHECIVYVDVDYKKEIERYDDARKRSENDKLQNGLNNL